MLLPRPNAHSVSVMLGTSETILSRPLLERWLVGFFLIDF